MEKDIVKELESRINHKLVLTYTPYGENQLRETSGILKSVNDHAITILVFDDFGEKGEYVLNRHGCALHSIIDYGLPFGEK